MRKAKGLWAMQREKVPVKVEEKWQRYCRKECSCFGVGGVPVQWLVLERGSREMVMEKKSFSQCHRALKVRSDGARVELRESGEDRNKASMWATGVRGSNPKNFSTHEWNQSRRQTVWRTVLRKVWRTVFWRTVFWRTVWQVDRRSGGKIGRSWTWLIFDWPEYLVRIEKEACIQYTYE